MWAAGVVLDPQDSFVEAGAGYGASGRAWQSGVAGQSWAGQSWAGQSWAGQSSFRP